MDVLLSSTAPPWMSCYRTQLRRAVSPATPPPLYVVISCRGGVHSARRQHDLAASIEKSVWYNRRVENYASAAPASSRRFCFLTDFFRGSWLQPQHQLANGRGASAPEVSRCVSVQASSPHTKAGPSRINPAATNTFQKVCALLIRRHRKHLIPNTLRTLDKTPGGIHPNRPKTEPITAKA
jgi:hypothetical protein